MARPGNEMSGSHGPLCPELHARLGELFGSVRIVNEGEALVAEPTFDLIADRLRWDIRERGEHYFVDCPFCNDTRQRLGISYYYGQLDAVTGRTANWLAHCFNEDCLARDVPSGLERRRDLEDMIFGIVNRTDRAARFAIEPAYAEPRPLGEVTLPGRVVTLDRLTRNHPAVQYLEGRGYDAAHLGRKLGVGYCVEADMQHPAARGRIIIPILMDGTLVGWQGRYVGDLDWKTRRVPKYYNLSRMPKKEMLYNIDHARRWRVVVVVESVTSVWVIGDAAVALLGHDVSSRQHDLLVQHWASKGSLLVLILDPDAEAQASRYFERLSKSFGACAGSWAVRMRLPAGKDPGDLDREVVWDAIYAACDAEGVDVSSYL